MLAAIFRIVALVRKELLAMFKDPRERAVLFVPPALQCLLFGYVATFDLNRVSYAAFDRNRSAASYELLAALDGSGVFQRVANLERAADVKTMIDEQHALLVVQIDQDFERRLLSGQSAKVQVIADGRNSNTAGTALNYVGTVVDSFNAQWRAAHAGASPPIKVTTRAWYNWNLETRWSIVPGLVGTMTLAEILLLTVMSVAREKEQGTFDQLLVTPFRPVEIMAGKALPPLLVGLSQSTVVLLVAQQWFRIPFAGSLLSLYVGITVFLLAVVGIGLLVSSLVATMQQALFAAFLLAMPCLLLSGLFTPLSSMPQALQDFNVINPARYMIDIAQRVYLEGVGVDRLAFDWTTALLRPVPTREWASAVSARPIEAAAWWTTFQDPLLSSLIERAVAANLDLRQATLRIAEVRALRDVSAAQQWPSLSANGSYTRQRLSEKTATGSFLTKAPGLPNPSDQFQYGFDASWEIDLFGRVRRSVEAADADTQASAEDSSGVVVMLLGDVARNYIELRSAQLRQAITTENLRSQRDVLDFTRDRQRSGIGHDLDVSNAAAQVATTEAQLPALENQMTQRINKLSLLLAREPGALRDQLQLPQPVPPVPPEVPIGLPADLVRRRADIRSAEARLHAATARVGVAVADLFPRLTLDAQVGFQALRFPDLTNWASRFASVGPNLDLPILDGGRRKATLRLEGVREQEAAIDYARTVLTALHEVENALIAYSTEQNRRASLEVAVAQNRDALTLARERYASGITNFLDVLDAERNLQQTELALADSTAAVSLDLVVLYKALGGGWEAHVATSAAGP